MKIFIILVALMILVLPMYSDTYIPAGQVSGNWSLLDSPFYVEGEINIPAGETLTIESGVEVIFNGHYKFLIYGYLEANGNEDEQITFTAANPLTGWHGLRFFNATPNSELSYCTIQHGYANGPGSDDEGGGVYCYNSDPVFNHCTVTMNSSEQYGGGMEFVESSPSITDCEITNNGAYCETGISFYSNCGGTVKNCLISNNTATTYTAGIHCSIGCDELVITHCVFSDNSSETSGGALFIELSNTTVEYCTFTGNSAGIRGGAIRIKDSENVLIERCIINGNNSGYGGGIAILNSNPEIINCTITGNTGGNGNGGNLYCDATSMCLVNSIVEGALNGGGIDFNAPVNIEISYCDFWNNLDNDQSYDFLGNVPEGLGDIVGENNNGDPSDSFSNIFLNPMFLNEMDDDFNLTENSPCIDAGSPDYPPDPWPPDDVYCDIGRFYYEGDGNDDPVIESSIILKQNSPNPFNPTTVISYQLSEVSKVMLSVYNLKGQWIKTLVNEEKTAGEYSVIWDGKDRNNITVPSGIYFYNLKTDYSENTRKMILMK